MRSLSIVLVWLVAPAAALAQESEVVTEAAPPESAPASDEEATAPDVPAPSPIVFGGYVEAYWSWNFGEPANGITNLRGFDSWHNSVTLANVLVDLEWDVEGVFGRLALQYGATGASYYLGEPVLPGAGVTAGTGFELWRYTQEARLGYRMPFAPELAVEAGLFLSPIGPESLAIHGSWNFSRANTFVGLPFYHTGIRISYVLAEQLTIALWGINGWNSVVDNNDEKTLALQLAWSIPELDLAFVYMTGVERPGGAPEGRAWRHLFDLHATLHLLGDVLHLRAHVNAGVEPNELGTSGWVAGGAYVRVVPIPELRITARGDFFWEEVATSAMASASAIFWPVEWVSSQTLTIEGRPVEGVALYLEYRHDHAASPAFFRGAVMGDGVATPFVPNTDAQDTITIGTTAWLD